MNPTIFLVGSYCVEGQLFGISIFGKQHKFRIQKITPELSVSYTIWRITPNTIFVIKQTAASESANTDLTITTTESIAALYSIFPFNILLERESTKLSYKNVGGLSEQVQVLKGIKKKQGK